VTSVVGVICTGGTKGRTNFVPKADAAAVARYSSAMSKLGQAEKNSMRAYLPLCPRTRTLLDVVGTSHL
jgi:hypothetical protein